MTQAVKDAFRMEREYQEEVGLESVSRIDGYDDFIFVNRNGQVQNQGTLNKAIKRIMRDCNFAILDKNELDSKPTLLPDFSCHILRHTFATRMAEAGLNVKFLQSTLGHTDVSTTLNIYVSVTNELRNKEISAFEAYLSTGVTKTANI